MKKAKELVEKFAKDRGWDDQLPDQVAKSISIEAAELLELFQWTNPKVSEIKSNNEKLKELSGELADVFIYSLQMAVLFGLDVDEIVKTKLDFAGKKYPVELMRKRSKGDSSALDEYLRIKKEYRQSRGK